MHGLHLIAELYDCHCAPQLLRDKDSLREFCASVCQLAGLTPVGEVFYQFGSATQIGGATGTIILAESHLAIHTWPELNAVTLDVYVCNFSQDNRQIARAACARLIAGFAPQTHQLQEIERGSVNKAR